MTIYAYTEDEREEAEQVEREEREMTIPAIGPRGIHQTWGREGKNKEGRMIAIIPNVLQDAINAKLDIALLDVPEAGKDRDALYHQLLDYFDETGEIPDFKLVRRGE